MVERTVGKRVRWMHAKPTVVYWNNGVSHYIVGRFNAVARRANLKFEAWLSKARLPGRGWEVDPAQWEFPVRVIPFRPRLGLSLQVPVAELQEIKPALMVSGYSTASWVLGSFAASAMGARTTFRVLPTYDTWVPRSLPKEFLKHLIFRATDGVKVAGRDGAAFAHRYGMSRDRTIPVTQSVDVEHYATARHVSATTRESERKRLALHGCVFIYVGRLWAKKGLDYLFDAYRRVREVVPDVSLLLVGDGVDEGHYREMARGVTGVVFAGFVQPRDLPRYYALGDVMVFPTLGDPHGLVVEEAMAAGLPVISSESAGDIRNRLPDARAGYVVPPANPAVMADRMLRLARDSALRTSLAREAGRIVCVRNHEHYAVDFEKFVDDILSKPRRRTLPALLARGIGSLVIAASARGDVAAPVDPEASFGDSDC